MSCDARKLVSQDASVGLYFVFLYKKNEVIIVMKSNEISSGKTNEPDYENTNILL